MNYSGRTTAFKHKSTKWKDMKDSKKTINYEENPDYLTDGKLDWNKVPHGEKPSIRNQIIFEVQWSDCPVEIAKEVHKLWVDAGYGNDHYYYSWEMVENEETYPVIAEYLKSKNITDCLIHWWW